MTDRDQDYSALPILAIRRYTDGAGWYGRRHGPMHCALRPLVDCQRADVYIRLSVPIIEYLLYCTATGAGGSLVLSCDPSNVTPWYLAEMHCANDYSK